MIKNDCGVFIDCLKIEFPVYIPKGWTDYRDGITVKYGELNGKWGFAVDFQVKTSGQGGPLMEDDFIYNSKNELIDAIRQKVVEICNEHFGGKLTFKTGHLDYILDKIYEKYGCFCVFENKEYSYTEVKTKDVSQIFEEIERIYKKPAKSFQFKHNLKAYFNPRYTKKKEFYQAELF